MGKAMDAPRLSRRTFLRGTAVATAGLAFSPAPDLLLGAPRASAAAGSLDDFMRARLADSNCPAIGAAAIYGGEVVWAKGYGLANVAQRQRANADTVFMLASVSKTVVAVAVMQAWEQGYFGLDDDVNPILGFSVRNPGSAGVKITPRRLLTHTSSIRDNWGELSPLYVQGDSPIPLGTFLQRYLVPGGQYYAADKNYYGYAPGAQHTYSNVGAALAGHLVEAATGTPFDTWCEQNIFGPLGMTRTSWHLAGLNRDQIALPYRRVRGGGWKSYGLYGYPDYPDGQLRTTPASLGRFLAAFANGGSHPGGRILQASTVNMMLSDQLTGISAPWQGLIWYREDVGGIGSLYGHNGGDSGVTTDMWFRRSDGAGAIVLANGDAYGGYGALKDIRDRLIKDAASL